MTKRSIARWKLPLLLTGAQPGSLGAWGRGAEVLLTMELPAGHAVVARLMIMNQDVWKSGR